MKLNIDFESVLQVSEPGAAHIHVEAAEVPGLQSIERSALTLSPYFEAIPYRDYYGNPGRRLSLPEGVVKIGYSARIALADRAALPDKPAIGSPDTLPAEPLLYLLPSRYCQSDRLANMATDLCGKGPARIDQVRRIVSWVHEEIAYQANSSNLNTSAIDTIVDRRGVCRDFAHICVALCRALAIPARYASGYCLDLEPQDFHAWFQVYAGGVWIDFDATTREGSRKALAAVAVGRDAADCAWSTFYGYGETLSLTVAVGEA